MNKYNKPFHTGISTAHQRKKKPDEKPVQKQKISVQSWVIPPINTTTILQMYKSYFSNQYSKKLLTAKLILDKIHSLTK